MALLVIDSFSDSKGAGHAGRRGPAPKIQQQLEQVAALPKAKQRVIAQVLDSMLAQSSGQKKPCTWRGFCS